MGRTREPRSFQTRSRPYCPRSRPRSRCVVCETEDAPNGCRVCSTCQNFYNEMADPHGYYRCFDDERCRLRNPKIDPRQRCPACWLDKCRREGMRFTGGARDRDRMESYSSPELRSRPDLSSRENDRERDVDRGRGDGGYNVDRGRGGGGCDVDIGKRDGGYDVDRGRGDGGYNVDRERGGGGYDEDGTSTYGDIDDRVRDYQERNPYSDMGEENGRYRYGDHFSEREERNGRYQSRGSFSYRREEYVDSDFFSGGGEEICNWNRINTPARRPFGLARDSRHSLSPPRLNGDRQAGAPLVNDWVTTVLRSLCALGGKANVDEIFFEKIQRQFPDKFRQSPRLFQEKLEGNPENFTLKKRAGEGYTVSAFTKLQLCPDHCTEDGCYNQKCDSLHICRFFLVSSCSAEKKKQPCKYGHKFESPHNDALLSQHGLGNLGAGLLKKLFQINRSEATLPKVCKFYNKDGGCNKDGKGKCWAMHICRPFLKRECKFGAKCKRSHNILDKQPGTILLQYGFDIKQSPEKLLLELREQINRS